MRSVNDAGALPRSRSRRGGCRCCFSAACAPRQEAVRTRPHARRRLAPRPPLLVMRTLPEGNTVAHAPVHPPLTTQPASSLTGLKHPRTAAEEQRSDNAGAPRHRYSGIAAGVTHTRRERDGEVSGERERGGL